ncbi:hypothetical protein [Photorhabdus tasmaniensis]|uniref:hypothetical protein n=1 Tax=Photorhabdus tasmaniensis TaxID=1004159 RepID=UPI00140C3210|nr:hypothetical protein [Photorhabdus tasmaniensis]
MTWEIPEPHIVHWPASLNWSRWWRLFSLMCFVTVVAASSSVIHLGETGDCPLA